MLGSAFSRYMQQPVSGDYHRMITKLVGKAACVETQLAKHTVAIPWQARVEKDATMPGICSFLTNDSLLVVLSHTRHHHIEHPIKSDLH